MTHLIIFHSPWMEFIAQITWKHMPTNYVVKVEKGGSLKGNQMAPIALKQTLVWMTRSGILF